MLSVDFGDVMVPVTVTDWINLWWAVTLGKIGQKGDTGAVMQPPPVRVTNGALAPLPSLLRWKTVAVRMTDTVRKRCPLATLSVVDRMC